MMSRPEEFRGDLVAQFWRFSSFRDTHLDCIVFVWLGRVSEQHLSDHELVERTRIFLRVAYVLPSRRRAGFFQSDA